MPASAFSLDKWYLDCVTDSGEAVILYCADLRWRSLHVSLISLLMGSENGVETQSSVSRFELHERSDWIEASFPRFRVHGIWQAEAASVEHTIYEQPNGSVHWKCQQPLSRVNLNIGGRELSGFGYAERLTLTLPPWKLPMRTLRWGRFVAPGNSLVWIDWEGPVSVRVAVHNGQAAELKLVTESVVETSTATLRIDPGLTLRSGRLGETILPGIPAAAALLPRSLASIEECKWRSWAELIADGRSSYGWAIHEVVDWKVK